jgi:hypothetical protein
MKSTAPKLVPVFIPSLGVILAQAEKVKGSPLTAAEAERIRDECACIMMEADHAEQMAASRGYRDVEPENCWADWHRLRVQLTGNGYLPKIVLCLLGNGRLRQQWEPILQSEGIEHEWADADGRMSRAFQASAAGHNRSLGADDLAAIAGHTEVLYLLSRNFTAQEAAEVSTSFLHLGSRLLEEAEAVAMKCESSGIAHSRARWRDLAAASSTAPWLALLRAYVQMPILGGDEYKSCGLHLLGQPDLIVSRSLVSDADGVVNLFLAFALYLLSECPAGKFAPGHTFRADTDSPRYRVMWEACAGYAEDDFFFNPFGRWRFAERA